MSFKAIIIDKQHDKYGVKLGTFREDQLTDGDTLVRVDFSSLNYKDGLAVTNKAPVVRRFPMIPGIDLAGTVEETSAPNLSVGAKVILNGWGTGETHLGAWAEKSRVWGKWLIPAPSGFTLKQTMAIGTAGYTAALCVLALQHEGVSPESGPVLVSGAAGGVGSIAVALLASLGFHVIASTGRPDESNYLRALGASEVIKREELTAAPRALSKERWAAAVDSVGSTTLANILSMTNYGGTVACCGLAGGMDLPSTVAPFILRGVKLIGIDSVMAPREKRLQAWDLLDRALDRGLLDQMTTTISLDRAISAAQEIVQGKVRGRIVVQVSPGEVTRAHSFAQAGG
ncbi:MAG: MDR family oxidoreductase [Dongiaceae bacterium]